MQKNPIPESRLSVTHKQGNDMWNLVKYGRDDEGNIIKLDPEDEQKIKDLSDHMAWITTIPHEIPSPYHHFKIGVYIRYFNQTKYPNYLDYHKAEYSDKKDFALWERLHETKNILLQEFSANEPNLVWVSDCTQFSLFQKTYYLCAILDLFSRKIIAYKISPKASTQLMTSTLKKALKVRAPDNRLLFHSDRGCQYTSFAFRKLLISNRITQSFSESGNPYDNGAMESFFSSLKQEEIYRTSYRSVQDCKEHITEYMEFYNEKRPHRANNYKTPNQTEELFYQRKKNRGV